MPCALAAGQVAMSFTPRPRSLANKFRDAFRGTKRGFRGESNFFVHLFIAAGVLAAAAALRTTLVEACLLVICVAGVLGAEMFNTAIERLAKAIDAQENS